MRIGATLAGIVGGTKLQTARDLGIEVSPEGLHHRRGDRAARRRAAPHPSLAANGRVGSIATHSRCPSNVSSSSDSDRVAAPWQPRSVRLWAQRSDEDVASELADSHTASTTIG